MLYLGIDQHARQITISLRNEDGDVLQARQVSTHPEKIDAFFQQLTRDRLRNDEHFIAVLEVCGFNDWLIRMLHDYRCHRVILIQPDDRKKRKTDRRDASALSELLWVNRDRLLARKPVRGLRQVDIAASTDQANRRLTTLRKRSQTGKDPRHQQDQAHSATSQPAMANADQDIPHQAGNRLVNEPRLARDRPARDESPAR
jgi:hypothetical protein